MSVKDRIRYGLAAAIARLVPPGVMFDRAHFEIWQKHGYSIVPNHFYYPIPLLADIPEKVWTTPSQMVGVDLRVPEQVALIEEFAARYKDEYEAFPRESNGDPTAFYLNNDTFSTTNAEISYSMIRHFKPRRVIEVGSGRSTLVALAATSKNAETGGPTCDFTSIEPYPNPTIRALAERKALRLIESPVQRVGIEEFEKLEENDIFFIDSSHILAIGSDVEYEFLELLPRLRKGVVVHVHDIFFPMNYRKRHILRDHTFFHEQYLLQAFLMFNSEFEVLVSDSYLHFTQPEVLRKAFANYDPAKHEPGSFWMRRKP